MNSEKNHHSHCVSKTRFTFTIIIQSSSHTDMNKFCALVRVARVSSVPSLVCAPPLLARGGREVVEQVNVHRHFIGVPRRLHSSTGLDPLLRKRMDHLGDLFVEARDEIEMAEESKGTTYFNSDSEQAIVAVEAAREEYKSILHSLEEPARGEFQRGNGLKMEQLKGELEMVLNDDDH